MNDSVRGVDHIGITVDDIEEAGRFLEEGLGATLLYQALSPSDPPFEGPILKTLLELPDGTKLHAIRMYGVGTGPGIELFQYSTKDRRPAVRACDQGLQHIAVYTDDMTATLTRLTAAGGRQLSEPMPLVTIEGGEGNLFCFVQAPFGSLIEVLTYPTPQPYEQQTALRRWKPPLAPA